MAIQFGELRRRREFSKTMKEVLPEEELSGKRRQLLLHDLYERAQTMKKLEWLAERLRAKIPGYRDLRKRAKNASGLLRRALSNIRKAVEVGESLLFLTVCKAGETREVSAHENFQDVEDTLNFFIEELDGFRQSAPALIPPEMRRPAEREIGGTGRGRQARPASCCADEREHCRHRALVHSRGSRSAPEVSPH